MPSDKRRGGIERERERERERGGREREMKTEGIEGGRKGDGEGEKKTVERRGKRKRA